MNEVLSGLDSTMERIKAFTRLALGGADPDEVFAAWKHEFDSRVSAAGGAGNSKSNLIPLLYACNDVLQESAKMPSLHQAYTRLFSPSSSLRELLPQMLKARPDLAQSVQKVLGIWKDRRVFSGEELHALNKHLFSSRTNHNDTNDSDEAEEEEEEEDGYGDGPSKVTRSSLDDHDGENEDAHRQEEEEPLQPAEEAREVQRKRLCQMPTAQLLAMQHKLAQDVHKQSVEDAKATAARLEHECAELTAANNSSSSMKDVEFCIEDVKRLVDALKTRRFALQARQPVRSAVTQALEKSIQHVEDGIHRAQVQLDQTNVLHGVLNTLHQQQQQHQRGGVLVLEGEYRSVRWVQKRERLVEQIVSSGPALESEDTYAGITAEDAAKSTRPMMWHKGLQMYVPLPTGNDSDSWRD